MPRLRQFQQFLAVAETMNFRRAAERLNMAQPPLTQAIRQLEAELGVRLFERGNRITGLTPAGHILREEAGRTIAQAERAVTLTRRAAQGSIGTLRLGFVASAVRQTLPSIVARFRARHPAVLLELDEATTARQVAALKDDRLDAGIVALPLADQIVGLATRPLREGRLIAALPADHALADAGSQPLALAALAEQTFILFPGREGPGLHGAILQACARAGFTPNIGQRAVQMETILGLVAAGLGVALVPDMFAASPRDGVVYRELDGRGTPIAYCVGLVWRAGPASSVLQAFIDCLPEDGQLD